MRKVILVVVMVLLSAQVMADMGRVSAVEKQKQEIVKFANFIN